MSYKLNLHPPVMSEEMKKELFGEDALKRLVENMKEREEEETMKTDKHTTEMTIPVTITVNGVTVYTSAKINETTIKEIYEHVKDEFEVVEEVKPDVKSYRLKMTQNTKDLLKLEWRSYDYSEGRRGFKLDEGIVFITLNKIEHFKGIATGEHLTLVENDKLLKRVREMTQVFIGHGYDEHDEMEIVKKVVC